MASLRQTAERQWLRANALSVCQPAEIDETLSNSETHQYESEEGLVLPCVVQSLFEQVGMDGALTDLLQQGCVLPGQALTSRQFTLYICGRGRQRLVQSGWHCNEK